MNESKEIGVIILAAGASSRLGHPKQLLSYAGKTLLQYTLQIASESLATLVVVVLGAYEGEIRKAIEWNTELIVTNKNWSEGIASTIQCGINALIHEHPGIKGALLMLCDQPYVTTDLLNALIITHQQTGKAIVASSYDNISGVPALFYKSIFPELLALKGDVGAKAIIQRHIYDAATVAFSKGNMDIDTAADYEDLQQEPGNSRK